MTSGRCKTAVHDLGDTSLLRWVHNRINVLYWGILHTTTYIHIYWIQNTLSGLTQNSCCKNGLSISLYFPWIIAYVTLKLVAHTILMPPMGAQSVVNTDMVQLPLFFIDLCQPACAHSYWSEGKHSTKRRWGGADRAVGNRARGFQSLDSHSDYRHICSKKTLTNWYKCSRIVLAAGTWHQSLDDAVPSVRMTLTVIHAYTTGHQKCDDKDDFGVELLMY